MKLNLDFSLYKGKTRLREWWKVVKTHFTAVQDAVNELDEANTELTAAIENEAAIRERVDGVIIANVADAASAIAAETAAREEADGTLRTDIDGLQKSVFGETKEYTATLAYHYDTASYSFAAQSINIQDDTAFDGFILTLTDSDGVQLTLNSAKMPNGWLVDWSLTLANTETARSVYLHFDTVKKRIWFDTDNGADENGFRIGDCGGEPDYYWLDFLPPAGEVIKQTLTPSLSNLATEDKSNILSAVNELVNSIAAEKTAREAADGDIDEKLTAEETARTSADNALSDRLTDEETARTNADNVLRGNLVDIAAAIAAETSARTAAENEIKSDITALKGASHTHDNKEIIDTITAEDVERWRELENQVTEEQLTEAIEAEATDRVKGDEENKSYIEYLEKVCFGFSAELQNIYAAMGCTVYDGGLFGAPVDGAELNGGEFGDEESGIVDGGDFESFRCNCGGGGGTQTIDGGGYDNVSGSVIDGGVYP